MAEGIAFDLVKGVLGKLGSALWDEIGLLRSFKDDADDLRSNFSAIQAVLLDAEERSSAGKESHALRHWLRKLKDAACDADDLLDEIRTQAEKVRGFLSRANPMHLKFKVKMAHRMKELREKIGKIAKQRNDFGLAEAGPVRKAEFKRPDTYSVVNEKRIVGRDGDKEKIVKLLLETNGDHDVSVIPIVGLGGLGKTTLAQLAFNDERVTDQRRFVLPVWVCVSTDFDTKTIGKRVITAARQKCDVTRRLVENCDDLDNMDTIARCLVKIFSQIRCLLVLDDVWNEDQEKWEKLKDLFKDSKQGSKILVTTRSEKVAAIMKTVEPHRVKGLSDDDCWTLFKRLAFDDGEENDYPSLVAIGKQIVKKCGGVPLAANALGSMMYSKNRTEDAWSAIEESEIWRLEESEIWRLEERTILPSLKLSYIQMPSALKQCFAYCFIFPKDYEIDKDDLIRQWIALGFISSHETWTSTEDIGNQYFNNLLWMSFLQDVKENYRKVTTCRMHDLVHDLAQSVAREEVAAIVGKESTGFPEGCRYASIHSSFMPQIPTTVVRRLRALQFRKSGSLIMDFYSDAKCLCLLDLHGSKISMLPSSIGKLKLIRYLNLSRTNIRELPESITGLCNLQTLNLSDCCKIRTLPKFLGRLTNLQILDLSCCSSLAILDSISNLQNLYALNLGCCEKIISLEPICHLKNLHYLDLVDINSLVTLPESIGSLQNLRVLNLSKCCSLKWLPSSLCALKNLRNLNLSRLNSLVTLPEFIGNLQNLRILDLSNCSSLESLPSSLCDLKNLHDLNLYCLNSLVTLPESIGSLQNLRILSLSRCSSLLSLPSSSSDLQHLEKLNISRCGKLCELPKMIQKLTKLKELLNSHCSELKGMPRGIGKLVSLQELPVFVVGKQDRVEHCASISELEHLKLVDELWIKGLENVTSPVDAKAANLIEKNLRSLKLDWNVLSAEEGTDSTVLPAEEIETVLANLQPHQKLEKLEIKGYRGGKFPSWMMNRIGSCLPNLIKIKLDDIPVCSSLPPLGQLPFLKQLFIGNMPAITNLGVDKFPALTSLCLASMPMLREWVTVKTVDDEEGRRERVSLFPCLTQLWLSECPQFSPEPCLPASVENLYISRTSSENLSLILERATPLDGGDAAVSLQPPPDKGLQGIIIYECQQLTCLPESLRGLTSLQRLEIWSCHDLERIEDWLGELSDLQSLSISECGSLRYLPARKMAALQELYIWNCPLLFDADGRFVDTSVDHIKYVIVDGSSYWYKKQASSSPQEEESSVKVEKKIAMAEGIAFDLVKGVLGKLGSALWDEIGLLRSFKDDADDLRSNFSAIQAVLLDAEERSSAGKETHALRHWLRKLKDAAYDADDLLDEIRTQAALRPQQYPEVQNQNQPAEKVRGFLSRANPMHLKFKVKMAHRMKELREKISKIAKQRHDFGLAEAGPRRQAEFKHPETFSVVDEKTIVGRDGDKEKIVKLLLETGGDHDVSVIPIVGLGGLGKTTLAQLACNDGRVTGQQRFDLRAWVCVSTDFDMKTIAKPVISAAGENCALDNSDAVASCLVSIFSQKRFLLALDDVWNEDQEKWEKLKVLFKDGKQGSKILVTTRSEKVAEIMRTVEPHRVKGLSDDDCWTLFKRRAFKEGEEKDYPTLVEIGKQIVKKCGGVPLAANALGSMMRFKIRTEDAWSAIRDSEIWRLEEEGTILPSLKLSYIQMPSALKQCFAYCSIFPKDYEVDKDDLIRQWIALGFISSHETWTWMEDIGNEYFNDLLWMSFLQEVDEEYRKVTTYRMHDLVHDLAQSVAREEVAVIVGEESTRIPESCRYVSIYSRFTPQVSITVMRRLRALQFRESGSLIMAFYSEAKCLRLLDLHGSGISEVPSSIGKLKLLRYLDLSGTSVQEMPEAITGLCNLQTLNLSGCDMIRTLPKALGRLVNLRNLDLSDCRSLTIPDSISKLQNLYALNLRSCQKAISLEPVSCLKNLYFLNLSGLVSLVTLPESIGSLQNLRILNLSECFSLLSLPSSSSDLQHLEKLDISGCKKLRELPKMFQKLTKLRVLLNNNCLELKGMPRGIGKLVSLQELSVFVICRQDCIEHCASISELEHLKLVGKLEINGLENVTSPVDAKAANLIEKNLRSLKLEWNVLSAEEGTDSTVLPAEEMETVLENLQPHQKLENLVIEGYGGGKFPSWMMNRIGSCLPNLVQIQLVNMPRCSSLPPLGQLPFLEDLIIKNMPAVPNFGVEFYGDSHITASANKFPALTGLHLISMPMLREWVTVLTVDDKEGRPEGVPMFPRLTELSLYECPQLRPEPCLPVSVEKLIISRTSKENLSLILERATPLDGGDAAVSLQPPPNKGLLNLRIDQCQQLTCLPESLRSLTSLHTLTIWFCIDLKRIEDWLGELTELQSLEIWGCSSLRYLPAHKMTTLQELDIKGCPLLFDADGQFVDTSVDHIKDVVVCN
ncbi:putative disease resistance protein RGA1 [Ananas comosus]|uniref:Putative disease resistance protein RGA1 n=1 Tax=Ananas comosus TaxID=4615 RepID=A0A199VGP7_ANACO|nr:putative disease resistance protein RGA1 [Ananas comosus]